MRIRKNLNGTKGHWDNGTNRIYLHFLTEYYRFVYIFLQVTEDRFLADCGFCRIFVIEKVHRQNRPSVRCFVLLTPFISSSSELYFILFHPLLHQLLSNRNISSIG